MNLIKALEEFDGKKTVTLERISDSLPRDRSSEALLWEIAEHTDARLQVGATWILKKWSDEGTLQLADETSSLVRVLKNASHWEVRLHLLQMLSSNCVQARSVAKLKKELVALMSDENKLVRAWSLSAFANVADQHKALREHAISILLKAEVDDSASVRARVRQVRKSFKWTASSRQEKQ